MTERETYGFRLIGHHTLNGFGGIGEGMSLQKTRDGRRILWLAHEGPPKNFTGVDVTDPKAPRVVVQTALAHIRMRSNSLEVCGDVMAVAYQTVEPGLSPAGVELFDISDPENPRSISFFDCSGPHSRGVHQLWYVDGSYIHLSGGAADFVPRHPYDDQIYRIVDVKDPARPREVGRWWMPGTREGDDAPAPTRLPIDSGFRAHNTNVYPQRPDRAYIGYLDGGAFILDIADPGAPRVVGAWNPHPPYPGFTHTVLPLFSRDLLVVTDECVEDGGADWPKLTWIVDARREDNLVPVSTLPLPPVEDYAPRGGRYGSHNLHENRPGETSFRSETLIFGTFFSGGVRAFDISNPLQPREVAAFVPPAPQGSRVASAQINDVYVDENGITYAAERNTGGVYILEPDF
ncbi:MAG: LVIVD repeat-containing protein [Pseudorhodoplanes sp.]